MNIVCPVRINYTGWGDDGLLYEVVPLKSSAQRDQVFQLGASP